MLNMLLSPNGRLNPSEFQKAAIILIVIGLLFYLPTVLGMGALGQALSNLSFVVVYPWIVIWIKRYHDAGKPGAMCLIPAIVYVIGFIIIVAIAAWGQLYEAAMAKAEGATDAEYNAMIEQAMTTSMPKIVIGGIALSFVIVFVFNAMIKRDPHDNQYGPAS